MAIDKLKTLMTSALGFAFAILCVASTQLYAQEPSNEFSSLCAEVFAEKLNSKTLLNSSQIEAVLAAISNGRDLKVAILNSEQSGSMQTLVILGEHHEGTKGDNDIGQKILEQFDTIGTEPHHGHAVLVAPLASLLILPEVLVTTVKRGLTRSEITSTSTLQQAWKLEDKKLFDIENGHKTGLIENTAILTISTSSAARYFCLGACLFNTYESIFLNQSNSVFHALGYAAGYALLANFAEPLIARFQAYAQTLNRDPNMAANIANYMNESNAPVVLVVMGYGHIPGVVKNLREKHSFELLRYPTDVDALIKK